MVDMGFAGHLVRSLYKQQRSNVKIQGDASGWFQAKQGCSVYYLLTSSI